VFGFVAVAILLLPRFVVFEADRSWSSDELGEWWREDAALSGADARVHP
jgi:hypothetical protein